VDRNDETPGCLARRLGQTELYEAIKMHGVYAEVLLNYVERTEEGEGGEISTTHNNFLNSKLEYDDSIGVLLDDKGAPVMMKWEDEITRQSAELLLPTPGVGRVLNVGFGMGIIDGHLQVRRPESHVIIEAHPAVIQRMKEKHWEDKPGVTVHRLEKTDDR
jgi:protein arginine N-methyltransferase 2